jgi:peptidylglycine monooxygenase
MSLKVILGEKRYTVQRDFGGMERDGITEVLSDVAVLQNGNVCVLLRGRPAIRIFSPDGEARGSIDIPEITDGHGITPDGEHLFIVDRDGHRVLLIDLEGNVLNEIGTPGIPSWRQPFNHPTAIARSSRQNLYITDGYGNARVHRFSPNGELLNSWGDLGSDDGEFQCPHGVTILPDDTIVVGDRDNNRLQLFSPDGSFRSSWYGFWRPMGVASTPDGNILVSDQSPALFLISPDGVCIGRCRPANNWPHGVAVSKDGFIYLAEMNPTSIVQMIPQ